MVSGRKTQINCKIAGHDKKQPMAETVRYVTGRSIRSRVPSPTGQPAEVLPGRMSILTGRNAVPSTSDLGDAAAELMDLGKPIVSTATPRLPVL